MALSNSFFASRSDHFDRFQWNEFKMASFIARCSEPSRIPIGDTLWNTMNLETYGTKARN